MGEVTGYLAIFPPAKIWVPSEREGDNVFARAALLSGPLPGSTAPLPARADEREAGTNRTRCRAAGQDLAPSAAAGKRLLSVADSLVQRPGQARKLGELGLGLAKLLIRWEISPRGHSIANRMSVKHA